MTKKIMAIFIMLILLVPFARVRPAVAANGGRFNGSNIVYYWKGDWNNTEETLDRLKDDGFNSIAICVIWYQETKDSTEIAPSADESPSDQDVISLIELSHKKGLKVLLRPYINIKNGNAWEGSIDFGNNNDAWGKWFRSYNNFIIHYAKIAENEDVELFSVGAELVNTVKRTSQWKSVISNVRKVYHGKILYTANSGNEKNIKFFDMVDYIGVDAYYTLTTKNDPTEKDFEDAWQNKYIPYLKSLSEKFNKKIILTEVGYRSIRSAYIDPWDYDKKDSVDYDMQAKLYKAFFNTIYKEHFIDGVFLWYAPSSMSEYKEDFDKYYKQDYAFFNKPAEKIIKTTFQTNNTKENPLLKVDRATAYYGESVQELNALSDYCDLLILQTRFLDKNIVRKIANKTLVAGYVSVLEFDGEKEDFDKYNLSTAVLGKNENWDSAIMDINNKNYQKYLLKQIQDVFESGAQGVFLDTVDDVDDYPQLTNGTVNFIKMLHEKYPDKFFIMNRGFTVIDRVVDSIQGILFEDFGTYYDFNKKCYAAFDKEETSWIKSTADTLKKYQDEGKLRVLASGYASSPLSPLTLYSKLLADEYGFAFYCSNLEITDVWFNYLYPMPRATHTFAE